MWWHWDSQAAVDVYEGRVGLAWADRGTNPLEFGNNDLWLRSLPYDGIVEGNIDRRGSSERAENDTAFGRDLDGYGTLLHPALAGNLPDREFVA